MIGFSVYHFATQIHKKEAWTAWGFLMGFIRQHTRKCVAQKCELCEAVKATACYINQQRQLKTRQSLVTTDPGRGPQSESLYTKEPDL